MVKSYKETKLKFSLKDELFNKEKVTVVAKRITLVYPGFKERAFINRVTKKFPELELKERIDWITHNFDHYIVKDYRETVDILLASLPEELDPTLTDDDFGSFILAPYAHFVATKGCNKKDLSYSLKALKEMTKRFSAEDAIRYFINAFPLETMKFLGKCAQDKNYHVRRLASEGTRAKLPWCQKISIEYKEPLNILDRLHADKTRYVTRSVSNHMNDISKIDAGLVIKTLKKWKKDKRQGEKELGFITKHSLRTLINQGNAEALKLVGYKKPQITVSKFSITEKNIAIGNNLEFGFRITSTAKKEQDLLVDYRLHFRKKDGSFSPKTFKIKSIGLDSGEKIDISKSHKLRSMSTKTLYPGEHKVELQINGESFGEKKFTLL